MKRLLVFLLFVLSASAVADVAKADADAGKPHVEAQGIAVVARGAARDAAFDLARAVYASSLRPRNLDEIRARVLAGDPPPPNATRELQELAEVRAAITGEDAPSRRLLLGIAQQAHVQGLLVVGLEGDAEAGTEAPVARLFLMDPGEFDAGRYEPEPAVDAGKPSWRATVVSLERRFPAPSAPPIASKPAQIGAPALPASEKNESKPFYASGWFWGAIAGAALIGGVIYFASRDTADDTIHLQMRVPR